MTSVPGQEHPDVNALADLAADVLPVEEARAVEAHVMSCPACADVLADAERIRPVLLADDAGPMPDDVWARISGALADEAATRGEHTGHVVPMSPVPPPDQVPWDATHWDHAGAAAPDGGTWAGWETNPLQSGAAAAAAAAPTNGVHEPVAPARPDRPTRRSRRREGQAGSDESSQETDPGRPRPEGYDDATGYTRVIRPLADLTPSAGTERIETGTLPALGGSRVTGALRPGRGTGPSRRDARDIDREPGGATALLRKVPAGRRGPLLAAAAGVVGAAVVGGIAWSLVGGLGGSSLEAGPSASAPIQQALNAPVVGTNDNYTDKNLAQQAAALAERAKGNAAPSTGQATDGSTPAPSGGSSADPGPTASGPVTGAPPASKLSDPAVLARCLTALSAEDQKPIAVDIARYENRDAAIIVLESPDGGIEVWAVSRDCGSGNDASFGFAAVAS